MLPRRVGADAHYSAEEVQAFADQACAIADALGLDRADREALLPGIFDKLCSRQVFYEQVQAQPSLGTLLGR
jgi:Tfp pilus assembly protein PilV